MFYYIIDLKNGMDVMGPIGNRDLANAEVDNIKSSNSKMMVGVEARMRTH